MTGTQVGRRIMFNLNIAARQDIRRSCLRSDVPLSGNRAGCDMAVSRTIDSMGKDTVPAWLVEIEALPMRSWSGERHGPCGVTL
jgi:hypothetical protein